MNALESLQAWLAVEHEAVWIYGVIGGRREDLSDAARAAWNRHRDTRDQLEAWIRTGGAEPDGPHLGYALADIDSDDAGRRAAQAVEHKTTVAAVSNLADPRYREHTVRILREAASAAAAWGASPTAFPGLDAD